MNRPTLLAPGEGEAVTDRAERTLRVLVDRDELVVTWFRYEPGQQGPDPHIHRRHSDAFYVLEGELAVALGPELERVRGGPGTFAAAPPGVVHTFANESDATAIFLNVHAPGAGFARMLRARRAGLDDDIRDFDQFDPPADGGRPFADAIVAPPGEGERFSRENRELVIKAALPELSVFDLTFRPGWDGVDPHVHDNHVDTFFVLEGKPEFVAGEELWRGRPGSFVAAPPGARHGFRLSAAEPIRVLNIHAPDAGFADALRTG